ncbi:GATA-type zinc finger protein 1 [Octodon degus]|uniref:GATA-type zinc finger protein 1 n=1 Tax=Octodon degus TaxID=10160 RepID=A0A6P3F6K0_OCTDE|nr:GATA-type zinc finger protein 1 [Octodon degus]
MEANLGELLRELLVPPRVNPESPPGPAAQRQPRPLRYPIAGASGRSLWPVCQDPVTIFRLLQESEEGQGQAPTQATQTTQAQGTSWEPADPGASGPLTMARSSRIQQTSGSQKGQGQEPLGVPAAPSQRRPRKQPKPCQGANQVDPGFKGVTLKFQIKADSSLQISPTYSLAGRSLTEGAPASPAQVAESNPRGSTGEALGLRRCASCSTQRTPLWRDAEDGTPLCNACGIRYKKYGTRCSGCWLVPRKTVQPKKLCGRCGVSLGPLEGPPQAM